MAPPPAAAVCLGVGRIVARAHEAGYPTIGSLHPELIYADGLGGRSPRVTGLLPRTDAFLRAGRPPAVNLPPLFADSYTAPEVATHGRRSPAGDVFSLCAMGIQCLTGRHPFAGHGAQHQTMAMILGQRQPRPEPASPLVALLERGIAPRPDRRIALDDLLGELAEAARSASA